MLKHRGIAVKVHGTYAVKVHGTDAVNSLWNTVAPPGAACYPCQSLPSRLRR